KDYIFSTSLRMSVFAIRRAAVLPLLVPLPEFFFENWLWQQVQRRSRVRTECCGFILFDSCACAVSGLKMLARSSDVKSRLVILSGQCPVGGDKCRKGIWVAPCDVFGVERMDKSNQITDNR